LQFSIVDCRFSIVRCSHPAVFRRDRLPIFDCASFASRRFPAGSISDCRFRTLSTYRTWLVRSGREVERPLVGREFIRHAFWRKSSRGHIAIFDCALFASRRFLAGSIADFGFEELPSGN
jgi:hypothetical protein